MWGRFQGGPARQAQLTARTQKAHTTGLQQQPLRTLVFIAPTRTMPSRLCTTTTAKQTSEWGQTGTTHLSVVKLSLSVSASASAVPPSGLMQSKVRLWKGGTGGGDAHKLSAERRHSHVIAQQ